MGRVSLEESLDDEDGSEDDGVEDDSGVSRVGSDVG